MIIPGAIYTYVYYICINLSFISYIIHIHVIHTSMWYMYICVIHIYIHIWSFILTCTVTHPSLYPYVININHITHSPSIINRISIGWHQMCKTAHDVCLYFFRVWFCFGSNQHQLTQIFRFQQPTSIVASQGSWDGLWNIILFLASCLSQWAWYSSFSDIWRSCWH